MHVHLSVTHPELSAHADDIERALRVAGDDMEFSEVSSERGEVAVRVAHADALVILVGAVDELRADGTVPGEWELAAATEHHVPVIAYAIAAEDERPEHHGRAGYLRARLVHFCEQLRSVVGVSTYRQSGDLVDRLRSDVDAVRTSLNYAAPEAFRSIHRRLRVHPDAHFDAVAVSMHNMDTVYNVEEISPNTETSSRFLGREPGGAGANTMVALSRLGLSTAVVGAVGDDPVGVDLRTSLEDDDVDVSLLFTIDGAESGQSVVIRDEGQNYLNIMSGGANDRLDEVVNRRDHAPRVREVIRRSRIVHYASFTGSAEHKLLEKLVRDLPSEAVLTFKPSTLQAKLGAYRLEAIVGRCDVLFVSLEELRMLLDMMPAASGSNMVGRLDALFHWRSRQGYVSPLIVVLYGVTADSEAHRLTVAWGAREYEDAVHSDRPLRLPTGGVRDTTGTRDAALAGVLYGLLRGRTPADCANLGFVLARSASAASGSRAGLPRSTLVRDHWREHMHELEPPRWLDPYGYGQVGSSTY